MIEALIALLHWVLSFFTDRLIFSYVTLDFSNLTQTVKTVMTFGAKAVFLLLLILLYRGIFWFFKKADRGFVRCFLAYFALQMGLLLLTWPGIWRMDEFGILNSAVKLLPVFWQNYLTSLFYVFSLMLFPFPSGVIILQLTAISLIVGRVVSWGVERFGKAGLWLYLPFLLFPVLDSNLYPMRMSLYAFLELFLLLTVWRCTKRKENISSLVTETENKMRLSKKGFSFCLLAALVTVWRTEAIYYAVLFPLLLLILWYVPAKKVLLRVIPAYLVLTLLLGVPQFVGDKLTSGNQYDLTSVVLPLTPLTERAVYETGYPDGQKPALEDSRRNKIEKALADIDRVVNVELITEGAKEGRTGISMFWSEEGFQKKGYTDAEYAAFKKAYYQLVAAYPDTFLKERFTCFLESTDLLMDTRDLFADDTNVNYTVFRTYPLSGPVSERVRNAVITVLEWKPAYGILLPIGFLLLLWLLSVVYARFRKNPAPFFLLSLPLVKLPLIFLTAPSRLFMYYYGFFLMGYVALCYMLVKYVGDRRIRQTVSYLRRNGAKETWTAVRERFDRKPVTAFLAACKKEEEERRAKLPDPEGLSYRPLISIVVPVYETPREFLHALLSGVVEQSYEEWELILADASVSHRVREALDAFDFPAHTIDKVHYLKLDENRGISANTNEGIKRASGDFIALLDHDDVLDPDALLAHVVTVNAYLSEHGRECLPGIKALYSDEDKCDRRGEDFFEPHYKPDFDPYLLETNNYICHFLMVRSELLKECKLRPEYDGAQDFDLILRIADRVKEEGGVILHTPMVLYHWRVHPSSTAGNRDSKQYAYDAGKKAILDHFERIGLKDHVKVTDSIHLGFYNISYDRDVLMLRPELDGVCTLKKKDGRIVSGPAFDRYPEITGRNASYSGYMHRLHLAQGIRLKGMAEASLAAAAGEGLIRLRDGIDMEAKRELLLLYPGKEPDETAEVET